MSETPLLPYAGTSGWSGSDTSRERAEHSDSDGTTQHRQELVLEALDFAGTGGKTAQELCRYFDLPTNSIAPSLTILHKEGRIARLKERRGRHEVYVLTGLVYGREESPYRPRGGAALARAWEEGYEAAIRGFRAPGLDPEPNPYEQEASDA